MSNLSAILKFIELTHKFQQVRRAVLVNNEERQENDVEHSYQLAMLAWYIISTQKINLDLDKVIKYSLVHDLVEVYAGDTSVFGASDEYKKTKAEREKLALNKIEQEYVEFKDMVALMHQYEAREDQESKFVYTLDKLIPVLNIYLDQGRSWKKEKVSFDQFLAGKKDRFDHYPEIGKYFEEMVEILKTKKRDLFHI